MKKTTLMMLAALLSLSACGGGDAGDDRAKAVSCEPDASPLTVKAKNNDFDTDCLAAKADAPFTIKLVNNDEEDHNISVYESKGGESLFQGVVIKKGETTYQVPAVASGRHYFQCDVHPDEMNGAFVVVG